MNTAVNDTKGSDPSLLGAFAVKKGWDDTGNPLLAGIYIDAVKLELI